MVNIYKMPENMACNSFFTLYGKKYPEFDNLEFIEISQLKKYIIPKLYDILNKIL